MGTKLYLYFLYLVRERREREFHHLASLNKLANRITQVGGELNLRLLNLMLGCLKVKINYLILTFPNVCLQGVSKKTWTFFEIGITSLFIKESFQNFVW